MNFDLASKSMSHHRSVLRFNLKHNWLADVILTRYRCEASRITMYQNQDSRPRDVTAHLSVMYGQISSHPGQLIAIRAAMRVRIISLYCGKTKHKFTINCLVL